MNGQEVESPSHRDCGCHSCSAPDPVRLPPSPGSGLRVDDTSGQRSSSWTILGTEIESIPHGEQAGVGVCGRGRAGFPTCRVPLLTARFEANDRDFPGGTVDKNPCASVRDTGPIPDLERSRVLRAVKYIHHHC